MSVAAINGSPLNQQTAQQCKQQQKCLQNSLPSSNNNNNSIRLEPLKLTILCIWFAIAVISNWVVLAFVHDLVSWEPMADPMFFLPQQGWAYILGDWMVSLSFTSLCLLLVFHRHRFLIFRRILFILALLNTLRSMMILLTRLPSSYADNSSRCRTQMPNNRTAALLLERTWEQAIGLGLQDGAHKMLCGDQMFSGHTAMMTISAYCWAYYVPKRLHLLKYFPKLFALLGIPSMVFSRTHYSCDVLVGYFLSSIIFVVYHSICENGNSEEDVRHQSLLYRSFILAKIIHWFERNMPLGRPDNQFEIPFLSKLRLFQARWKKGHLRENSVETVSSNIFIINKP